MPYRVLYSGKARASPTARNEFLPTKAKTHLRIEIHGLGAMNRMCTFHAKMKSTRIPKNENNKTAT
jgi:hypothetical protein